MQPVQLKSNEFWGKRFGATYTPEDKKKSDGSWGWHFPKAGFGSPGGNSGKSSNTAQTQQSKADKKKFIEVGRPVIRVTIGNKRIRANA